MWFPATIYIRMMFGTPFADLIELSIVTQMERHDNQHLEGPFTVALPDLWKNHRRLTVE